MKNIPTRYNNRNYRSRLEARWAVMLDLLNWKYEYEPYDLNGWIPDFVLFGKDEILVEVKPYSKLDDFDTEKILNAVRNTAKEEKEVLLLGNTGLGSKTARKLRSRFIKKCLYPARKKVWT